MIIAVTEQDIECDRLGMPEYYGERFSYYRGIIEDTCKNIPRGAHIGDETWLQEAKPHELVKEATDCVNERHYMEVSLPNQAAARRKTIAYSNRPLVRLGQHGQIHQDSHRMQGPSRERIGEGVREAAEGERRRQGHGQMETRSSCSAHS